MLGMTGRLYLYGLHVAGRFYILFAGHKENGYGLEVEKPYPCFQKAAQRGACDGATSDGRPGRPDVRNHGRSYQLGEEHGRLAFTRATVHTPKNIRGVAQFSGASKRIKFVTLPGI